MDKRIVIKRLVRPDAVLVLFLKDGSSFAYYRRWYARGTAKGDMLIAALDLMGTKQADFNPEEYRAMGGYEKDISRETPNRAACVVDS